MGGVRRRVIFSGGTGTEDLRGELPTLATQSAGNSTGPEEPGAKPMRLLGHFSQGELRLTRIGAFSDGVFAIILAPLFFIVPPTRHRAAHPGAAAAAPQAARR